MACDLCAYEQTARGDTTPSANERQAANIGLMCALRALGEKYSDTCHLHLLECPPYQLTNGYYWLPRRCFFKFSCPLVACPPPLHLPPS